MNGSNPHRSVKTSLPQTPRPNRRDFLRSAATLAAIAAAGPRAGLAFADPPAAPRKRMAIVTTVWRYQSHAQHMGDRFLVGYPQAGAWHKPALDVVSLYVDQHPAGDQKSQREEEFGCKQYPNIAAALRCGGDKLAVDAVLIIGEHGDYPRNELGQVLYPRYPFFKQVADVFRQEGRGVPVFNDKHLSWKWEWAKEMVETSRELKFPLLAGSSLPGTWRMPAVDMPWGGTPEELMCVAMGRVDSYDFHALETIQCMAERRKGGETGVAWVEALRGDAVWKASEGSWDRGGWDAELFAACLARSQTLVSPKAGFGHRLPQADDIRRMVADPVAYRFQYADGVRATMLLMNGLVGDFTFAARLKGQRTTPNTTEGPNLISTLFYLPPTPNVTYSAELMSKVEQMFQTGQPPFPVERTLLTSGVLAAAMQSLSTGKRVDTPHLNVRYTASRESQFARA